MFADEYTRINMPILFLRRFSSYFVCFIDLFLSLNRLTILWKYTSHEQMWARYEWLWITFSYAIPFIFSFQELFNKSKITFNKIGNSTLMQLTSDNAFNPINSATVAPPVILIGMIVGLALNTLTFILWRKRKVHIPVKYRSFELKLLWITTGFYTVGFLAVSFDKFFNS